MGINLGAFIGPLIAGYLASASTGTSASRRPDSGWHSDWFSTCLAANSWRQRFNAWRRSRGSRGDVNRHWSRDHRRRIHRRGVEADGCDCHFLSRRDSFWGAYEQPVRP
jgi:hypothetical protein